MITRKIKQNMFSGRRPPVASSNSRTKKRRKNKQNWCERFPRLE